MTAGANGNVGVDVLSTPNLVGIVERACANMLQPYLESGEATVGAHIDLSHLAPTPVGMKVTVRARISAVEGRKIIFHYEAVDEENKIAEGTHTRVIVNLQRLMERTRAKKSRD
jgi:predicted thioesterase